MSEARRCRALKIVESTSLMIGDESEVSLSIDSVSSPVSSSSVTICRRNSSVASSSTRWDDSLFLRISWIAVCVPTQISMLVLPSSISSSSIISTSAGSATTTSHPFSVRRRGTKL